MTIKTYNQEKVKRYLRKGTALTFSGRWRMVWSPALKWDRDLYAALATMGSWMRQESNTHQTADWKEARQSSLPNVRLLQPVSEECYLGQKKITRDLKREIKFFNSKKYRFKKKLGEGTNKQKTTIIKTEVRMTEENYHHRAFFWRICPK